MFCTKCGNKLEENQKFCSKCGNNLSYNNFADLSTTENVNKAKSTDGAVVFSKTDNNTAFSWLFKLLRERKEGIKYIICFLILLFMFDKLDGIAVSKKVTIVTETIISIFQLDGIINGKGVTSLNETIIALVQLCMLYIWFVILSKKLKDINLSVWCAIPLVILTYTFYSFYPWYIAFVFMPSFPAYRHFIPTLLPLTLVFTALPNILLGLIKSKVAND